MSFRKAHDFSCNWSSLNFCCCITLFKNKLNLKFKKFSKFLVLPSLDVNTLKFENFVQLVEIIFEFRKLAAYFENF